MKINLPVFPNFKNLELKDRDFIQNIITQYCPETSELSFTNMFIWQHHYDFKWSIYKDWLIVTCTKDTPGCYALPPIGPISRTEATLAVLQSIKEKGVPHPRIKRADERLIAELTNNNKFEITETPAHFDYVYKTQDLINLEGRKFKAKRNHINKFKKLYKYEYIPITDQNVQECIGLSNKWCELQKEDVSGEWEAVNVALKNFEALELQGGTISVDGKIVAFSTGERLNKNTAVIHIEKADTEISGSYAIIGNEFAKHSWSDTEFINREQDLGVPGLRKSKLSYNPDHLVKKFEVRLALQRS